MKNKKVLMVIIFAAILIVGVIVYFIVKSNTNYMVTFNTDGGTKIASVSVKKGNEIKLPTNPTKEGYTFKGWFLNNKVFDSKTKITSNITLKASWIISENKTTTTVVTSSTKKTTTTKKTTPTKAGTTTTTTTTDNSLKSLSLSFNRSTISYYGEQNATASISCNPANADGCEGAKIISSDASGQNRTISISGKTVSCTKFGSDGSSTGTVYALSADGKVKSSGVTISCEQELKFIKYSCTSTSSKDSCSYVATIPVVYSFEHETPGNIYLTYFNGDKKIIYVNAANGTNGTYIIRAATAGGQNALLTFIRDY